MRYDSVDSSSLVQLTIEESEERSTVSESLFRETEMVLKGVGSSFSGVLTRPHEKLPELAISSLVGTTLGVAGRLGAPGKAISVGIGTAMLAKMTYDEVTGNRWSTFASAVRDTWITGRNMKENIASTRDSLGSFLVDTTIGYASGKVSSYAVSRLVPPSHLVGGAVRSADRDGGAALYSLQQRWEDPRRFRKYISPKEELLTYSQSARPGTASGDLIKVTSTPEGNTIFAAMDVEGHGVGAAKKAVRVHAAIDAITSKLNGKKASDVLSMIDGNVSSADELSITAGLMVYNPVKHTLQTATASSELAYVVRANGRVRQLDAHGGGLPLGVDLYNLGAKGNDSIRLSKGDTVIMASDGVFDRFGYMNKQSFKAFLRKIGPDPGRLKDAILGAPAPKDGADDTSFLIFHRG